MRHALRSLCRTPAFTVIALVTLALGIGLNTAMFSIANKFLLQPLNFPDADNLFRILRTDEKQRNSGNYGHAPANVLDILHETEEYAQVAAFRNWGFTLSDPPHPAEVLGSYRVTSNFFATLGVTPELGRFFLPEEDAPGKNAVLVLSHAFWLSRYKGDPSVIGRVVRLDGGPAEIVGVLPASAAADMIFGGASLYRPLGLSPEERASRTENSVNLIVRPRAGVTSVQLQTRLAALAARLRAEHPATNAQLALRVLPLQSTGMSDTGRRITYMLLGLSGFVLLIACANLANLLLARAISRAREFAIRAALGASRSQLIRPLFTECSLLALGGGAGALFVSVWTTDWMAVQLNGGEPGRLAFPLDARVLLFTFGIITATGFLFGVAPAWLVSRVRVNDALKAGARGTTGDRSHQRLRQLLIVAQFGLALVLLTGAGYFIRGLDHLLGTQPGWQPDALVRGVVSLPPATYPDSERILAFYNEAQRRLQELPGVESTAVAFQLPLFGFTGPRQYDVEGRPSAVPGQAPSALVNGVTPEYFFTVGTRLLRGRTFTSNDGPDTPGVVIINEAMERALFPDGDAIGRRLVPDGADPKEIVGVVEDVRFLNIDPTPVRFQVYQPLAQEPWGYATLVVRAPGARAAGLVEPFRKTIAGIDQDMPVMDLRPVTQVVTRSTADLQMIKRLLIGFAVLGLFLAALGIYGVIARIVAQRTSEIGIRIALGAQLQDIFRLILGSGLRMAIAGTVLGLLGSFALSRFLLSSMPGLATDPTMTLLIAVVVLLLSAFLACWLPALRATRVDPTTALRAE